MTLRRAAGLLVAGLFCLVAACAHSALGPFVPKDAHPCFSDVDCADDEQCRFPAVDTRPVCMYEGPGSNATVPVSHP